VSSLASAAARAYNGSGTDAATNAQHRKLIFVHMLLRSLSVSIIWLSNADSCESLAISST
jgi:hypothetical protein